MEGPGLASSAPTLMRPTVEEVRAQLLGVLLFTDLQVRVAVRFCRGEEGGA